MLRPREDLILTSIIRQYILRAAPISSGSVLDECGLDVSSATVRNDVMRLEEEGYIIRPHHAAGSVPSDKGYRHYVSSLKNIELPLEEQFLINHLFHQVEDKLEEWLNLAVTLLAQQVKNVALVTTPRPASSRFKHLELVSIQPQLALAVLVLHGAKVRQQLINCDAPTSQENLTHLAARLNRIFSGQTVAQIEASQAQLAETDRSAGAHVLHMMQAEDAQSGQGLFLEGWHFLADQPEFAGGARLLSLINLAEQKKLPELMQTEGQPEHGVRVIIGHENLDEAVQGCSLVISPYGLPDEPLGSIAVVGPTRMQYERTIAAISYVSSLISLLVTELYGIAPRGRGRPSHN
jgi:heat-inducible transcriptional repressor